MSSSPRTYLVTGAAGFIGSYFVDLALKQGHKVIALDALTYSGNRKNLAQIEASDRFKEKFEFVHGNICDGRLVQNLLQTRRPNSLINFAAESHVDRSIDTPSTFIDTNIRGTHVLLEGALEYWKSLKTLDQQNFVYMQISTDEVYGSLGPQGKFNEASPVAPNSPYSASKASADLLVRAWNRTYGLPTLITNSSNNYGPRQHPEKLIPRVILSALRGLPIPIYGDGKQSRDWIHVEDNCRGIFLALEKGKIGSTYCLGGGAETENKELILMICRELDQLCPRADSKPHESTIQYVTDRPGHDRRYAIDDSLAAKELRFTHKHSLALSLRQTIEWYLDHPEWWEPIIQSFDLSARQGLRN